MKPVILVEKVQQTQIDFNESYFITGIDIKNIPPRSAAIWNPVIFLITGGKTFLFTGSLPFQVEPPAFELIL
jgi:hypothetical protein